MRLNLSSTMRGAALVACVCGVCLAPATAANPGDDSKIMSAVTEPTHVDFTDVALTDIVEYLSDFHGIPVSLDEAELAEIKVTGDSPFTYRSKTNGNVSTFPLYRALWEMLGKSGVSFMVADQKLLITSAKKARAWQADFTKGLGPQLKRGKQ